MHFLCMHDVRLKPDDVMQSEFRRLKPGDVMQSEFRRLKPGNVMQRIRPGETRAVS